MFQAQTLASYQGWVWLKDFPNQTSLNSKEECYVKLQGQDTIIIKEILIDENLFVQ